MLKTLLVRLFRSAGSERPPQARLEAVLTAEAEGRLTAAETGYRELLASQPSRADLCSLLGRNLLQQGRLDEGVRWLARATQLDPSGPEAHYLLGGALRLLGRHDEAVQALRAALALRPEFPAALNSLGNTLMAARNPREAETAYLQAHALQPELAEIAANLATLYMAEGWLAEALRWYRQAWTTNPALSDAHSNYVACLNYDDNATPEEIFAAHRTWAERHAEPLRAGWRPHTNDPTPGRRLRVGYVSSNFIEHPATYFLESTMQNHDPSVVETFCYSDTVAADGYTERMKAASHHWRETRSLTDEALAERVREDAIDILVDLNGHIKDNRLLAFARKPAPVQVTWSGYPNTTGLSAMDYRITDGFADPPGMTEHLHSETLLRMPQIYMAFTPPPDDPEPGALPMLEKGHVTFGSFNIVAKLSPSTIAAWAILLREVPEARLIIATAAEGRPRQRLVDQFRGHGVDPARLVLEGRLPRARFNALMMQADIALDSFPYNGTTTTCHALWMGLPVIALAGKTHLSRVGVSMLSNLGLPELVAASTDDYIRIAAALSRDKARLADLRSSLRLRMQSSPLIDGEQYARHLESALRAIWRRWCEAHAKP